MDAERHLFLRHLIANVKCAVCQHQYQPDDIQIVEDHEDLWVLSVVCSECHTQGLIFAIVREVSADQESMLDIDEESLADYELMPAIDKDEILDMHRLLSQFNGDMYDLLEDLR